MSSAPKSSAGRFRAVGASRRRDAETGQAPQRGATARRTRPVRITVDLDPADYRTMRRVVDELADATDIPALPHSRMWRAVLAELAEDPALMEALAARIRAED